MRLTETGRQLLDDARSRMAAADVSLVEVLSAEERRQLVALLEKLAGL